MLFRSDPPISKQRRQLAPASVISPREPQPEKPCDVSQFAHRVGQVMNAAILVAVVDDDESVRESLPGLLDEFGFVTKTFATAEEFLQSGLAENPKCLILDIAMPRMSGPELHRELLKLGYSIPTIFMSARPEFASQPDMRQGAVEFLLKPFNETVLLGALEKALDMK